MGALTSRQNADVEETDIGSNHAYRYPPKSGKTLKIKKKVLGRFLFLGCFVQFTINMIPRKRL